jgi:hypothetical protein
MLQANQRIIEVLFWLRNLLSHLAWFANEEEFFENSSDELGTRYFRQLIVNDGSDES